MNSDWLKEVLGNQGVKRDSGDSMSSMKCIWVCACGGCEVFSGVGGMGIRVMLIPTYVPCTVCRYVWMGGVHGCMRD